MFFRPARKISMEEPNCQTDNAISVYRAVPGLPIQLVETSMPIAPSAELTKPLSPKICDHIIATATLPPMSEGR
ncbi:hypothetical protein D3C80_2011930 [compost metagenome]